tara:strand:+ start:837 stop:1340 length:504 start_codon:yes stop_codon:yes gene_type:complete
MKYQIHKNFLAIDFFEKIKNLVMNQDFPWRRRDQMTFDANDKMYFSYGFYNIMAPQSEFYQPYIIPILKKLHAKAPIEIRANMFISALFKTCGWHTDHDFKCKTAILYLNDCDGGTELKINDKITFIKADANKMLVFDTPILHRVITSQKEPIRYIINFNYFTSQKM